MFDFGILECGKAFNDGGRWIWWVLVESLAVVHVHPWTGELIY